MVCIWKCTSVNMNRQSLARNVAAISWSMAESDQNVTQSSGFLSESDSSLKNSFLVIYRVFYVFQNGHVRKDRVSLWWCNLSTTLQLINVGWNLGELWVVAAAEVPGLQGGTQTQISGFTCRLLPLCHSTDLKHTLTSCFNQY